MAAPTITFRRHGSIRPTRPPDVTLQPAARPVPLDKPLPPLGQHLLGVAIALDTHHTSHVPDIDPRTATARQANDYMNDRTGRIYPSLVPRLV